MSETTFIIHLDDEVCRAIPLVARDLGLASDALVPGTVEEIFTTLILDHALRIQAKSQNDSGVHDHERVLQSVLDPHLGGEVLLRKLPDGQQIRTLTLLEQFEELSKDANDPYVLTVQGQKEDNAIWRMALATVYQTIKGPDRKEWSTWVLVERTFRMLKQKPLDNGSPTGDNRGAVGTQPNDQPEKE